jgi:hypothetical protein
MSWWILVLLLGLLKLPVAALMLWMPFRDDYATKATGADGEDDPGASEDDGGTMALPASPLNPHPHSPRPRPRIRGPHGSDPRPLSPPRIRFSTAAHAVGARTVPSTGRGSRHTRRAPARASLPRGR